MQEIVFVTSNTGKVKSAQKYFDQTTLIYYKADLNEPRSESLEEIAKCKVLQAYEQVKRPCFVVDSGFYIEALNGWPGSFINFNLAKLGLKGIIKLLAGEENRQAYFKDCLAYYDGVEIKYFYGESKGTMAQDISESDHPDQWSSLWHLFIPLHHTRTLADMSEEERNNRIDGHTSPFYELNNWLNQKMLIK